MPYEPLESTRTRYFGGTTNMWTGWCKPLDPIDLRPRPWLGLSGWLITPGELEPLSARAVYGRRRPLRMWLALVPSPRFC